MFPSLPVSTLCGTIIETCFDEMLRFAVIADHLLLNLYSLYQNDLLLHGVGLVPVLGHGWF